MVIIENKLFMVGLWRGKTYIHIFRQVIATIAASFVGLSAGLAFGYSAVLLPQLKADDGFPYDAAYESWIAAVTPLAMAFGCICAGTVIEGFGRKGAHFILCFLFVISWMVLAFATSNSIMLLGRFLTGLCAGAHRPVTLVYLGEISDPKYRSVTLFCPSLFMILGVLLSHVIGTLVYWRVSSMIFCFPNIVCFAILLYLKESPFWLIAKGNLEKGEVAFKWFREKSEAAETELKLVLDKLKTEEKRKWKVFFGREFLKPMLPSLLLGINVQFCGINVVSIYAQDILQKTFPDKVDIFILMVAIGCVRLFASSLICSLSNMLPRKITFLACNFSCCLLLLILIVFLHINPPDLLWLPVTSLLIYVGLASVLVCLGWTFVAELFPDNLRGLGSGFSASISFIFLFIIVKFTTTLINDFGEIGMYALFGSVTFLTALALCFILPDTSGRTLQDIQNSLK